MAAIAVVFSFLIEALFDLLCGRSHRLLAVLPLNGFTTGAMNWQTFSHMAFAFKITPGLLIGGIIFALIMGVVGGLAASHSRRTASNRIGSARTLAGARR